MVCLIFGVKDYELYLIECHVKSFDKLYSVVLKCQDPSRPNFNLKTFTIDSGSKSSRQDSLWEPIARTFMRTRFIDISEVTGPGLRNGSICVKSVSKEIFCGVAGRCLDLKISYKYYRDSL